MSTPILLIAAESTAHVVELAGKPRNQLRMQALAERRANTARLYCAGNGWLCTIPSHLMVCAR
jgi:hypothetical protein